MSKPRLTRAQKKHLLRAYRNDGVTDAVTYGPLTALQTAGLARELEVNPCFARPMGMQLTKKGWEMARELIQDDSEVETHEYPEGPDPDCYGCQGTGFLRWAGVPTGVRCSCVDSCGVHERVCPR